jgi:hypothetical protein
LCCEPWGGKSEKCCGDLITVVLKTISGVAAEVIHNLGFAVTEKIDFSMELDDKRPRFVVGKERVREIGELNRGKPGSCKGCCEAHLRDQSGLKRIGCSPALWEPV